MVFCVSIFIFFVFRTNGKKEHLDENNFCHWYGNFFESAVLKFSYLIAAMLKVFSRQFGGTLTTVFERHSTVEDFTRMDQYRS